jgi:hypothetical protein
MRPLIIALALLPALAAAQPSPMNPYQPPDERGPQFLDEQRLELPPYPKEESLIRVQVDGGVNFDFFVDLDSVSVGADGIVRYTLVARSTGGASNIVYEGMRCRDRERKLYASGRPDKTWTAARNPKWIAISDLPSNRVHNVLDASYFCPRRMVQRGTEEARKALQRGGDPSVSGPADVTLPR